MIETHNEVGIYVVQLTERGEEVCEGLAKVPGIGQPAEKLDLKIKNN